MPPVVKRPTAKDTKDAMLAAFDRLNIEYKALLEASKGGGGGEAHAPAAHTPAPSLSGNTMEDLISALQTVRNGFGNAISTLSGKLTAEATRLEELRATIGDTTRQIKELHGLDINDKTLTNLIVEYEQRSELNAKELAEKKEAAERELTLARRSWEKEKGEHARLVAEANEAYQKRIARDAEEYRYALESRRALEADAYDHQKKHDEAALDEFRAAREKEWAAREAALADREKAYAEAKQKVDEFPQKLEAALKKAREEGKGIATSQAKVKADLIAKEIEGEKRVSDLKVKTLEETIKEQAAQLAALTKQLNEAHSQAKELAVKSIEGASNANTFQAVKEIALEQAKNPQKNK